MGIATNGPGKQVESVGQDGRSTRRISIPEGIGVIVGISTVLLTFVNSGDLRAKIVIVCVGGAAVLFLMLVTHLVTDQPRSRHRTVRIMVEVVALVALIVGAIVISPHGRSGVAAGGPAPTVSGQGAPAPFITQQGYGLRPSSSIATNDQDKVDVDTGCPGWGNMRPRLGPSRCGEVTEVIADEEGIHTADGGPHLYPLAADAHPSFDSCVAALDAELDTGVNQVDIADLKVDDQICIRTDKRNVALVRVEAVTTDTLGQLTKLTIGFTVWKP